MNNFNRHIEAVERSLGWHEYVVRNAPALRSKWNPAKWACLLSCYDFLGRGVDLEELLTSTPPQWYSNDSELLAVYSYAHGRLYQSRGYYARAMAFYMRAATLARTNRMRMLPALQAGTIERMLGNNEIAEPHLLATLQRARSAKDSYTAAHVLDYLVGICVSRKDFESAWRRLEEARALADASRNQYRQTWVAFTSGELEVATGNIDSGISKIQHSISIFRTVGARNSLMHGLVRLTETLLNLGRIDLASVTASEASDVAKPFIHNIARVRLLRCYSRIARFSGNDSVAARLDERADILYVRADREIGRSNSGLLSYDEVNQYLRALDPALFEILCGKILGCNGLRWSATSQNQIFFDLIATQDIGVFGAQFRWAVSCKRWFGKNVGPAGIPANNDVSLADCGGLILMTTKTLTREAQLKVQQLENSGVKCEIWSGDRIITFVCANEWLLAEVAHPHWT